MLINQYIIDKEKPMGFGDFIRGCIACHQFSLEENFEFDIDLGPFSKYYKSHKNEKFKDTPNLNFRNCGDFLQFKEKLNSFLGFNQLHTKNVLITTNTWPENTIDNIKENNKKHIHKDWGKISKETKKLIKSRLKPISCQKEFLNKLPKQYEVVHIRAGDFNAFKTSFDATQYIDFSEKDIAKYVLFKIAKILRKTKRSLIILSDSNAIKKYLSKIENSFKSGRIIVSNIQAKHSGVGGSYETFHDLTILNNAKKIHQFSVYTWGSGFSNIAHHIYDVPIKRYKQIRFDNYFRNQKIQERRRQEENKKVEIKENKKVEIKENKKVEIKENKEPAFKEFCEWHQTNL